MLVFGQPKQLGCRTEHLEGIVKLTHRVDVVVATTGEQQGLAMSAPGLAMAPGGCTTCLGSTCTSCCCSAATVDD